MGSRREQFTQWLGAIGAAPEDDENLRLKKVLLVASSVMLSVAALLWGTMYLALGRPISAAIPLGYSALSAVSIWLFARDRGFRRFRTSQLALQLVLPFLLMLSLGGLIGSGGVLMWSLLCPLGALVFASDSEARIWFAAFLGLLIAAFALDPLVNDQELLSETVILLFGVMNIAGVSIIVFVLMQYFTVERDSAQATSEALLLNILPGSIAKALKAGPDTIAEHYEGVSVLFADIVDFTEMSAQLSPTDLVELLNEVFTFFDEVTEELGIEKIKTIGDCYMAAAGVPEPRDDHAQVMTELAIRVRDHMQVTEFGGRHLEFRIGINSGPVVAGVIGIRKFIYDLWGDAVNTASRMESHGERGSIQITEATYELIRDEFRCEAMGSIDIKGKGEMPVWHVLGSASAATVS